MNTPLGVQTVNEYRVQHGGGFGLTLPAGTYDAVVVTAPGDGTANAVLRVAGDVTVLSSNSGRAFFARGMDASASGYDVHAYSAAAKSHVRTWSSSGAEVPLAVSGDLWGHVGHHHGRAHGRDAGGNTYHDWVANGAAGDRTAVFPEEAWEGPSMVRGMNLAGDTREDSPFTLVADVTL